MKELIERAVNEFLAVHGLAHKAKVFTGLLTGVGTSFNTMEPVTPETHGMVQVGSLNKGFVTLLRSQSHGDNEEGVLNDLASTLMIHGVGYLYNRVVQIHNETAPEGDKFETVIIKGI